MHDAVHVRRRLLALPASIAFASFAAAAFARPVLATEERSVSGFDELSWDASGELTIEQTGRERLRLEAEPHVLRRIVANVRGRRLEIGFAPGSVQTDQPIRFRLELRDVRRIELRGSGQATTGALRADALTLALHGSQSLHIDTLQARRVELLHAGAGDVRIGGGRVDEQRIVLDGSGTVDAEALDARGSDVRLVGSGEVRVAAHASLAARIDGSGDIVYRGQPQVSRVVHGAGEVRPLQR